jgi:hypothetical protein
MPEAWTLAPLPAELRQEAPSRPELDGGPIGGMLGGVVAYPRVHFEGHYGVLCGQSQEFVQFNLSWDQIKQVAWDAFGLCPKTVTVFDNAGAVLYRGSL